MKAFNDGAADAIFGLPSKNPYGFENKVSMDAYNAGYASGLRANAMQFPAMRMKSEDEKFDDKMQWQHDNDPRHDWEAEA